MEIVRLAEIPSNPSGYSVTLFPGQASSIRNRTGFVIIIDEDANRGETQAPRCCAESLGICFQPYLEFEHPTPAFHHATFRAKGGFLT